MKVIIIHGCPSNVEKAMDEKARTYDKHWIPWIKNELYKKDIESFTPLMPEPWKPIYEKWKKEFDKFNIYEEDILIGHSCGCAFLVRYLNETKKKIKKLILVAPWKIPDKEFTKEENDLYDFEISKDLKNNIKQTIIFTSNDEEKDGKESAKIFKENLNGKLIELKNHGHFTIGDMRTEEFPELLKKILK